MKQEQLSRRGFLKGAGLGALAVSGMSAGLLGGCAPQPNGNASKDQGDGDDALAETGEPLHIGDAQANGELTWLPTEPADPTNIEEELTADVVIVGCGTAGTCAARAAAEEGASVIVVEKADHTAVCRSVNGPSLEARPTSVGSAALDRPTTSIPTKSLRRS